jgi:hypothetical protein
MCQSVSARHGAGIAQEKEKRTVYQTADDFLKGASQSLPSSAPRRFGRREVWSAKSGFRPSVGAGPACAARSVWYRESRRAVVVP